MANKKITELVKSTNVANTDLLLLETANGTRSIAFADIKKPIDAEILDAAQPHPFANNAAAHNAIFRGKDLTNVYTVEQICQRISAGTFEDLYIGDYFDVTINGEGSEVVRCILAGFDTYLHNGDTSFEAHHAVIVTKNCLTTTHGMNPTNTAEGGFQGSDMWKTVLPKYNTAFGSVFGSHLLSHKTLLTNAISTSGASMAGAGITGYSNDWSWVETKLGLLSEIQVYGVNVFSSSSYDAGCDNLQLPLFALDPTAKVCRKGGTANADASNRQWYWLRNVASDTDFAVVSLDGNASGHYGASNSDGGVRPLFCIG